MYHCGQRSTVSILVMQFCNNNFPFFIYLVNYCSFISRRGFCAREVMFVWPQLRGAFRILRHQCTGVQWFAERQSSHEDCTKSITAEDSNGALLRLHEISTWKKPERLTLHQSVALRVRNGVGRDHFSVCVVREGTALELIVEWRNPLAVLRSFQTKWLQCSS